LKPLPLPFYIRPAPVVARELLGKNIIHNIGDRMLIGKIVEVEAYRQNDPASHSYRGMTVRNEVMFRRGGHLYVYFTYGMHFCANVVTGSDGTGEAVLIRAVEPLTGIDIMAGKRYRKGQSLKLQPLNYKSLINLTNGPAKFCEAFGISRDENGTDLLEGRLFISGKNSLPARLVGRSSRIGINSGLEKNWRFFIRKNPWVSK
jgi:DNA-3-methyladenine glycosylase